ncbi:MAG: choice-of-anchor I family protein [Bacteroidota bacterium]
MHFKTLFLFIAALTTVIFTQSCNDDEGGGFITPDENPSSFTRINNITIGGEGAAEIAAYDPATKQLFVVNNADDSRIDVIDFSDPVTMRVISSINVTSYGGGVNSVAVGNGLLAAAIEADRATDNGSVVIFNISDLSEAAVVTVGALPDMVTFTPDGSMILVANEGEPSDDYTVDPNGSISMIDAGSFSIVTRDFTGFNGQESALSADGFRVTGPNASLAADVEPEYIAISPDSRTAYVALQENNGLAVVDISNQSISRLLGLGLKDYSASGNEIDPSDEDDEVSFRPVPSGIFGVYQPDALDVFSVGGANYVITANEGDGREYFYEADEATCTANGGLDWDEDDGCLSWIDEDRLDDIVLDPTVFPNAAELQEEANFGRLKVMTTNGDTDGDGDFDQVWSYGARSFSIWDADGNQVFDSGNELGVEVNNAGLYADGRSDDKGVEPEGVVVGEVNGRMIAFIGLERVDAVAVYDVTTPSSPQFLSILETGDAPEGMVFINAEDSPTGNSILIVTCEDDGTVWAYSPSLN